MDGLLLVDKPAGWTSHDVVAKLRGLTKERQIGHLGTLDPLATGVLPLALGAATRLIEFAPHDKQYRAGCRLGMTTDSEDVTGKILAESSTDQLEEGAVREALLSLTRLTQQVPPMVSALKKGGKRLYELAREGKSVERAPRPIRVTRLEVLELRLPHVAFLVDCSGGTYVRSLCREVGEKLGVGGCLESLRRTRSGSFTLDQCQSLEELQKAAAAGNLSGHLRPAQELVAPWPAVAPGEEALRRFCQGQALAAPGAPEGPTRVVNAQGRLVGMALVAGGALKPQKVFGMDGIA
ncbi:MAG TPA: tRNA pseudouridine(55) synthase TruB [bacterium]|nr:tRNA pseudouridine(55) synthase TruB [bacterium]